MTNEQTLRCICIAISKRDENTKYTYGYDPANPGYYYFQSDVYFFHNTEIMTRDSWMLPGILRDIAGAMGRFYTFAWETYYENFSEIGNTPESCLKVELDILWYMMDQSYGSDYCAGIEREVVGG